MRRDIASKAVIVDYGISNMFSVQRACDHAGLDALITSDKVAIGKARAIILPGVGAFGDAVDNLNKLDLISPVRDFIASGRPFLGICLGMQLLMDESEEFGRHRGLGVIKGNVVRFPEETGGPARIKVPHIGWSRICFDENGEAGNSILDNVANGEYMYFIHSFYVKPSTGEDIVTTTDYSGIRYCSGLRKRNVFAFQFHPEKSGMRGVGIYRNFKNMIDKGEHR